MGVKYRVNYRNHFNDLCRIDILHEDYVDDPIILRGVADRACIISWDCPDDPYEPIVNSKAAISIWQTEDYPIDILELQQAQDREFGVEFYIEGVLKFKGFMIPDGIQQTFQSAPFELNINATDGLMMLDGMTYSHNNLEGGRCILNYFRQILFSQNNLELPLPIVWVNSLVNDRYPLEEDIFSGSIEWAPRGEGFTDYNGNTKDCMYIIEGMLRAMQSRIMQTDGKWVIWRINDVTTGSFIHRETPATLEDFDITVSEVIDEVKRIGGKNDAYEYAFIEEDAILTVLPGLKTVISTYNQDQRENILPNGSMDIVDGTLGRPIYWELINEGIATLTSEPSLSKAAGSSVKIINGSGGNILFLQSLPIDTDILYTYLNFGFKFSIESWAGVDVDGYIVWEETAPFNVQLIYNDGTDFWYLNEFGFWTQTDIFIDIDIPRLKIDDVAQFDFNSKQDIVIPLPNPFPIPRTTAPSLYVGFNIQPNLTISFDDVYINVESNSDVYESEYSGTKNTAKEEYALNISSSHNGFYVSNFMTNFHNSGLEKFYTDPKLSGASLTEMNSHAILRNRYKPSLIFDGSIYARNYKYAEIYTIKTLADKKFLPLKSSWNTETNTTNISVIEIRDDGDSIMTKHYGKNDQPLLSN